VSTLLLVHAHPDDECITTGGVMLRAHLDGHRVVLVTATAGEEGEIHNMDEAAVRPRLAEVRAEELRRACEILGVDRQVFLGYRDSGMAGTPGNADPRCFHAAPLAEAADRLAAILRGERPAVVVTYTADGTYGHPDHVKAHHVTLAAVDGLDGERPRVYLHAVPRGLLEAARMAGIEVPDIPGVPDEEITTEVDVSDLVDRKLAALTAHRSQMDPSGAFASMGEDVLRVAFGVERFVLARGGPPAERPERSLFAGGRV